MAAYLVSFRIRAAEVPPIPPQRGGRRLSFCQQNAASNRWRRHRRLDSRCRHRNVAEMHGVGRSGALPRRHLVSRAGRWTRPVTSSGGDDVPDFRSILLPYDAESGVVTIVSLTPPMRRFHERHRAVIDVAHGTLCADPALSVPSAPGSLVLNEKVLFDTVHHLSRRGRELRTLQPDHDIAIDPAASRSSLNGVTTPRSPVR